MVYVKVRPAGSRYAVVVCQSQGGMKTRIRSTLTRREVASFLTSAQLAALDALGKLTTRIGG